MSVDSMVEDVRARLERLLLVVVGSQRLLGPQCRTFSHSQLEESMTFDWPIVSGPHPGTVLVKGFPIAGSEKSVSLGSIRPKVDSGVTVSAPKLAVVFALCGRDLKRAGQKSPSKGGGSRPIPSSSDEARSF